MKLTAQAKLLPTEEQAQALRETLERANAACDYVSAWAWEHQTFRQFAIQKALYQDVKARFALTAQVVVRVIGKVADAYKLDKKTQRTFRPTGAVPFDDRILRWYVSHSQVSIWTTQGRMRIAFACGDRQRQLLATQHGESDLVLVGGSFYLLAACDVEEPEPGDVSGVLGVDLGICNIATDSDGTTYSGAVVNGLRHRHRRLRQRLQKKGTKSAKRLLRHRRVKEARFARNTNHRIAKQIVATAECTGRGIALEDLKGIRERVKVRKPQRATLSSWAFAQLGGFIGYKAQAAGVLVVYVDPRNTSRTCPACGSIDKHNRPSQSVFRCASCGFSGLADHIAACNIASRGAVNLPHAAPGTG